jgi:ABC-2 type transport system permease protein
MNEAFLLELRRSRSLIAWIAIAAVAYGGIMAWFWPIMRDNAALFEQYMNIFPKEFLTAFGMEGSLGDPGVFFTTYVGSWLWPILAALAAIVMATRPVAVDLERGFLDLPLATGLSRARYLGAAIAAQAVALAALAFITVLGFWVASQFVAAPYELGRMLIVAVLAWVFACAIAACALLLSVVTLSRAVGGGIVAATLLAMYLLNIVATMQPDLSWLASLSAMHYFRPTEVIDHSTLPLAELALFSLVAAAAWMLAELVFRRRNLAA